MLNAVIRIVAAVAFMVWFASSAHAAKRVALVIGISSYKNVTRLVNPVRDARAVALPQQALNPFEFKGASIVSAFAADDSPFRHRTVAGKHNRTQQRL